MGGGYVEGFEADFVLKTGQVWRVVEGEEGSPLFAPSCM